MAASPVGRCYNPYLRRPELISWSGQDRYFALAEERSMSKVLISGDRANAAKLAAGEWCQAAVFAGLLSQTLRDYKTLLLSFFKPP